MSRSLLSILGLLSLLLICCKPDSAQQNVEIDRTSLIQGKWLVTESTRNRKPTTTLKDAYFSFDSNEMKTNVLGVNQGYSYHIAGETLTQSGEYMELVGDKKLDYKVLKLTSDSLVLSTKIRNYNFMFYALKELEEAIQ